MTPYNDIDLVQIGSGNEWLVAWRRQACSALSHYLNKLKGRWLSGVPDYFDRKKISSGGDLSHYSSASLY